MFFDPQELKDKFEPVILNAVDRAASVIQPGVEALAGAVKALGRNQTRMLAMQALIMQSDPMTMGPEEIARKADAIASAMEDYNG